MDIHVETFQFRLLENTVHILLFSFLTLSSLTSRLKGLGQENSILRQLLATMRARGKIRDSNVRRTTVQQFTAKKEGNTMNERRPSPGPARMTISLTLSRKIERC